MHPYYIRSLLHVILHNATAAVGAMDAAVVAAEVAHRQQLHTIKAAALVNLAYLQLQQQRWQQAVAYSHQLLQVITGCYRYLA